MPHHPLYADSRAYANGVVAQGIRDDHLARGRDDDETDYQHDDGESQKGRRHQPHHEDVDERHHSQTQPQRDPGRLNPAPALCSVEIYRKNRVNVCTYDC